jgi:hypothetical protein
MSTIPTGPDAADVVTLGNAVLSKFYELSITKMNRLAGRAGLDVSQIPFASESRAKIQPAISAIFAGMSDERRLAVLTLIADGLMDEHRNNEAETADLANLLRRHGFQYINGSFIRVAAFDERERPFLPNMAFDEITDAFSRLAAGDDSGAVTKACGAVDSTMQSAYAKLGLGQPPASFQTKVNTVFDRLDVYAKLRDSLVALNVPPVDAQKVADEAHETIKHAAELLQVVRRVQGDVHGTKLADSSLAYDAIKLCSVVCGLLRPYL